MTADQPTSEEVWGTDYEIAFATILEVVAHIRTMPLDGGDLADAAGMCRRIERDLQAIRLGWNEQLKDEVEVPAAKPVEFSQWDSDMAKAVGKQFQTKVSRSAKRTYRTASIVQGVAEVMDVSTGVALNRIVMSGAAKIDWKYLKLKGFLEGYKVDLKDHTVKDEAVDDDGTIDSNWMGEVWTETYSQQAIAQEEQDE